MRNHLLDDLKRDSAYAVRTLSRTPAFSGVAVATLALGIGATTAIFSVINAVILRPLPYPDSNRLVRIVETGTSRDGLPGDRLVGVALSDLPALREQSKTLSHVGVYAGSTMTLTRRGDAARVEVTRVSPSLLAMVHARPQLGRSFEPRDETPGSDQVAILSHSLWLREFGGASDVIGQGITLDGRSYSIVGVMPGSFEFPDRQTQLWTPYVLGGFALRARIPPMARLADRVSLDAATIEVRAILGQLQTTADSRSGQSRVELRGVHDHLVQPFRPALKVLAAAVGFVLLIACVNVANLVLARTTSRERELTIRASLGAGRARLIRQLLTETLVLGLAGGLAGSAVAVGGVRILRNLGAILPRRDLGGRDRHTTAAGNRCRSARADLCRDGRSGGRTSVGASAGSSVVPSAERGDAARRHLVRRCRVRSHGPSSTSRRAGGHRNRDGHDAARGRRALDSQFREPVQGESRIRSVQRRHVRRVLECDPGRFSAARWPTVRGALAE